MFAHFARLLVYTKICLGLDLDKKIRLLVNFSISVQQIPYKSFSYKKSRWKFKINVVISQEFEMVWGESNEING